MERTTAEVLDDHLRLRLEGNLEADLQEICSPEVVMLCHQGVFHGHGGIRQCAAMLETRLRKAKFEYRKILVEKDFAFLGWSADSETAFVEDGVDSFVIRGGRIEMQSVCYKVQNKDGGPEIQG